MTLAYSKEKPLFIILLLISLLVWIALIGVTFGGALLWVLLGFIFYLFVQSGFIAYLKGTAVHISEKQYPEIYQMHLQCCEKLGIEKIPEIYMLNGDGLLNALATRFLGRHFVVLFTDVVDALQRQPGALKFYIGHELGHIKQKHLLWGPILMPAKILPILGAAYSRACEYSCDIHGQACCDSSKDALAGVAVLAAGDEVWNKLNVTDYAEQSNASGKFWMALHELVSDYPWLVKRMARIIASAKNEKTSFPKRNPFAFLFAVFVPRIGLGAGAGGLASMMIIVAIIGILAAIAIPAYQGYIAKAQVSTGMAISRDARQHVEQYIIEHKTLPRHLSDTGFELPASHQYIASVDMNSDGAIEMQYSGGLLNGQTLEFKPYLDKQRHIQWNCRGGTMVMKYRPAACR